LRAQCSEHDADDYADSGEPFAEQSCYDEPGDTSYRRDDASTAQRATDLDCVEVN
jgi:hypothetical protein